jgi:carbohydrate-selective porin OprB
MTVARRPGSAHRLDRTERAPLRIGQAAAAIGADLRGAPWHRPGDKLGLAAVSSDLADDHRRYLALGGKGFLLGDGRLRYGRETLIEAYYTARVHRGLFAAADLQLVARPGYNRDRGPIAIGSLRLHAEL